MPRLTGVRPAGSDPRGLTAGYAPFQLLADSELQLAGGFLRERDGDNLLILALPLGDQLDDAGDELGCLPCARGRFDDEGFVEGVTDAGAIGRIRQNRASGFGLRAPGQLHESRRAPSQKPEAGSLEPESEAPFSSLTPRSARTQD